MAVPTATDKQLARLGDPNRSVEELVETVVEMVKTAAAARER
jgi:hypothetical protein